MSAFAGFPTARMFHRWRPNGTVIRVDNPDPAQVIARVRADLRKTMLPPSYP